MNITSYNVTDVGYHLIGLRVLSGLPANTQRHEQTETISRSIRKYVNDKALRLMLPEPRGTFETAGEKVCQELTHLQFAKSIKGAYQLTEKGNKVLDLLNSRENKELRRVMVEAHLRTYDNLRLVVSKHLDMDAVWRPVVSRDRPDEENYIASLLAPTFGLFAKAKAEQTISEINSDSPGKLEDALGRLVLRKIAPEMRIGVPMFRSMCDRLVSLRLLNQMRLKSESQGTEFLKTYTPCVKTDPPNDWYVYLDVRLDSGEEFPIYFCEPDMTSEKVLEKLIEAVHKAFHTLTPMAGYFDLPEVRDLVNEQLNIPEAAFDEGLNRVLDLDPCPFTVGLKYEGTTGRRKPLVRDRGSTQIYNLIREA